METKIFLNKLAGALKKEDLLKLSMKIIGEMNPDFSIDGDVFVWKRFYTAGKFFKEKHAWLVMQLFDASSFILYEVSAPNTVDLNSHLLQSVVLHNNIADVEYPDSLYPSIEDSVDETILNMVGTLLQPMLFEMTRGSLSRENKVNSQFITVKAPSSYKEGPLKAVLYQTAFIYNGTANLNTNEFTVPANLAEGMSKTLDMLSLKFHKICEETQSRYPDKYVDDEVRKVVAYAILSSQLDTIRAFMETNTLTSMNLKYPTDEVQSKCIDLIGNVSDLYNNRMQFNKNFIEIE